MNAKSIFTAANALFALVAIIAVWIIRFMWVNREEAKTSVRAQFNADTASTKAQVKRATAATGRGIGKVANKLEAWGK